MKKPLAAAVLAATFLTTGGAALALTGTSTDPAPVVSDATDSSSFDTTTTTSTDLSSTETDSQDSTSTDSADSTDTTESTDSTDASDSSTGEHPDNHGADVSSAAHTCPTGPGHGECVSAVAHDHGGSSSTSSTSGTTKGHGHHH